MRGTELLVPAVMATKLRRANEARLSRLTVRSTPAPVRNDPCSDAASADCVGTLKPINRPA